MDGIFTGEKKREGVLGRQMIEGKTLGKCESILRKCAARMEYRPVRR